MQRYYQKVYIDVLIFYFQLKRFRSDNSNETSVSETEDSEESNQTR